MKHLTDQLDADHIFNMDDTPVYIEVASSKTLDFVGNKNVDGATTDYKKSRLTVAITTSASGRMLKAYVIFKGLINVPRCTVPANIVMNVSMGGSVKEELMIDNCRKILRARGTLLCNEDSVLLLDSHSSNLHDSVKKEAEGLNTKLKIIPRKTAIYLQPQDVAVNSPFKTALRGEWNEWYENSPEEYTPKGSRKRTSYEWLLKMVSNAVKKNEF